MNQKLKRHEIDFEKGVSYFQDNLTNTNALSSELVRSINFKGGSFFTFLPYKKKKKKIHEFKYGGIAKGIIDLVSLFLLEQFQKNKKLSCIFDDVSATFRSNHREEFFASCGLAFQQEVYYLVNHKNASIELIKDCLYMSNAIWHSLCVLFEEHIDENLSLTTMKKIAIKAQLIMLGAYDGEGFVFWERSCSSKMGIVKIGGFD